jgi:transposase InsO family protein
MGPLKVASMGYNTYVATLLDVYSRYGEVFCMENKKPVQDALTQAIPRYQRQSGHQCQLSRTYRGKEYMGKLSELVQRKVIIHQRSSPYTPEQNGRSERYNRTLIESTNALLLHQNLPIMLWRDAISTAAYFLNNMPKRDSSNTPWELFSGEKLSISHLRTFGCQAYVHQPAKLGERKTGAVSQEAMLTGYAQESKAWRFFDMAVWHTQCY